MRSTVVSASIFLILLSNRPSLHAQEDTKTNYQDRRAVIINNCPFIELSKFSYFNYNHGLPLFIHDLSWKNTGAQALVAFEVILLQYYAFDRRMIGEVWSVTGRKSDDWRPLPPGASDTDRIRSQGPKEVFTGIAYIRAARLADGTVWNASDAELLAKLRSEIPGFKDFGDLKPDPKPKPGS